MFVDPPKRSEQLLKYTLIALGVTFAIVILLAPFLFDITPKDRSGKQPTKQESATLSPEEELKFQERIAPLIKAGDMKACESIQNDMYKKVCINNIAQSKALVSGDVSSCEKVDGVLLRRDDCERRVLYAHSISRHDITLCGSASSESFREQCEENFLVVDAFLKNDISMCDKAGGQEKVDYCRDYFLAKTGFKLDPEAVSCDDFRGADVRADCMLIKQSFKEDSIQHGRGCSDLNLKTGSFFDICL